MKENEKFDFFVGTGIEGTKKLATMDVSKISKQNPPLKAYFSEDFLWFKHKRPLLPNIAHLIQSDKKVRACVIGNKTKCGLEIIEKFIRTACKKAGLENIEIYFSSERELKKSGKNFICLPEDHGAIFSFLYSVIKAKEIEPLRFKPDPIVYMFDLLQYFESKKEEEFIKKEWDKMNKSFNRQSTIGTIKIVWSNLDKAILEIEKQDQEKKNIYSINKNEYFFLLVRQLMEVLAKSHPIVMHRQTFYENFIHILLAAEEFKKTNKEFVTLIRMINHTSNSFHGIAPYSAESYEKNLLIEYASSEKDLPVLLTKTYEHFMAYDVWAILGSEKILSNVIKNLTSKIIKKYNRDEKIELITDDSLENIVIAERLKKELSKTRQCSIKKTVSKKRITLYVCSELRIMFSHMKSVIKQVTGVVGIINNTWRKLKVEELPKDQFFYFQYEEV